MDNARTPSVGLKILKTLYSREPLHQGIRNSLINAYIRLGFHTNALSLISTLPVSKTDINSLKFKAWLAHQQKDFKSESALWDVIIDRCYYGGFHGILGDLIYRGNKKIVLTSEDIPFFSVVRNEILRLPFLLEYYRRLGVTKFFFTDNNSDDGSLEFLLGQPDCYVFWTNSSHNQAGAGMVWNQYLIKEYVLDNQWYLVIDADEFLVYPSCETHNLSKLTNYLDSKKFEVLPSYVLDMFPSDKKKQLLIKSGDDLIKKSPFFYNHYVFNHQIESPYHMVQGGIFYAFGQALPINVIPLFKKTSKPIKLLSSRHLTTPTCIANITSCLLHFKFIGDFHQKSLDEMQRKEHWAGGIHYRGYTQLFGKLNNKKFTDLDKVVKYQNSLQLVELGLIKTSEEWENYASK